MKLTFQTYKKLNEFVKSDAASFASRLADVPQGEISHNQQKRIDWMHNCVRMKDILPIQEQFSPSDSISIYDAITTTCQNFGDTDILVRCWFCILRSFHYV